MESDVKYNDGFIWNCFSFCIYYTKTAQVEFSWGTCFGIRPKFEYQFGHLLMGTLLIGLFKCTVLHCPHLVNGHIFLLHRYVINMSLPIMDGFHSCKFTYFIKVIHDAPHSSANDTFTVICWYTQSLKIWVTWSPGLCQAQTSHILPYFSSCQQVSSSQFIYLFF